MSSKQSDVLQMRSVLTKNSLVFTFSQINLWLAVEQKSQRCCWVHFSCELSKHDNHSLNVWLKKCKKKKPTHKWQKSSLEKWNSFKKWWSVDVSVGWAAGSRLKRASAAVTGRWFSCQRCFWVLRRTRSWRESLLWLNVRRTYRFYLSIKSTFPIMARFHHSHRLGSFFCPTSRMNSPISCWVMFRVNAWLFFVGKEKGPAPETRGTKRHLSDTQDGCGGSWEIEPGREFK